MISAMFTEIGAAITAFSTALGNGITSVISMFYSSTDGITPLGSLLLVGVGAGLVFFGWRLIKGLISLRHA